MNFGQICSIKNIYWIKMFNKIKRFIILKKNIRKIKKELKKHKTFIY